VARAFGGGADLGLLDPSEVCFSVTDYEEGPPEEEIGWISGDGQYFGEVGDENQNYTGLIALRTITCKYFRDSNISDEAYVAVLDSAGTQFVPTDHSTDVEFRFDRYYPGWVITKGDTYPPGNDNWKWEQDEGGNVQITGDLPYKRTITGNHDGNGTGFVHASIKVEQNGISSCPLEGIVPFFVVSSESTFFTRENGDDTVYATITDGVCKFRIVSGHQTVTIENLTKGTILAANYPLPEWPNHNGLYSDVFEFSDPDVQHLDLVWVHGSGDDWVRAIDVTVLATKHRPVLRMHHLDFSWTGPIKVDVFIEHATLKNPSHPDPTKRSLPPGQYTLGDLDTKYDFEDSYLDLPNDKAIRELRPGLTKPDTGKPTVYWKRLYLTVGKGSKDRLAIQYWFFYMSSCKPYYVQIMKGGEGIFAYTQRILIPPEHCHEGDWEMCMTVFKVEKANAVPNSMTASQHYGGQTIRWENKGGVQGLDYVEKDSKEPDRPVIYIADRTHATYFSAGKHDAYVNFWEAVGIWAADIEDVHDLTEAAGEKFEVREYAPPKEFQGFPGRPQRFYWWEGRWGEPSSLYEKFSGPRSPHFRKDDKGNLLMHGKKWHNQWILREQDEDLRIP
jgi:hypothetical protein